MATKVWSFGMASIATVAALAAWGPPVEAAKPGPPPAGTVCTWGGTAAAPTGTFTITPGLTSVPLAAPAKFYVTCELGGDPACAGSLTYIGQIDASGTCELTTFEGDAKGIPGVTRFAGIGAGPL